MSRLEGESIYRRVAVRMHGDEKVQKLSKPEPSGKGLWYELLIGEQTGIIPGLFKVGEAAFAEQLEWDIEGFRKAFKEVSDQKMAKADWKARLVFVPKAIFHNKPASTNVIIHWRDAWDLLPECDLKLEAWQHLRAFAEGCGKPWLEAFDKACPKPFGKATSNQGSGIRDQGSGELTDGGKPEESPASPPALTLLPQDPTPPPTPLLAYLAAEFPQSKATHTNEKAWAEAFPGVDLLAEAKNARRWELDNPTLIKTQKRRFLGHWFAKAQNDLRRPTGAAPRNGAAGLKPGSLIPAATQADHEAEERAERARGAGPR